MLRKQTCPPVFMRFFAPLLALLLGWGLVSCQRKSSGPSHESSGPAVASGQDRNLPEPPSAQPALGPSSSTSALPAGEEADPLGDVLSADLTPGETSSRLLALLPSTPADDRAFLVQLAGNYCPDEEYWRLLPFLLDRNQPEDCREELLRDLLRRPDAVRLRPLYRLALDPTHPLSTEAKEYLFAYLQDVPENDFSALARAVEKAERENP